MTARRYVPPHVVPLELWDVVIDDTPLYLVPAAEQAHAIARLVDELRAGKARRLRQHRALIGLTIDHVVVAGGGPVNATVDALLQRGIAASAAADPVFVAEAGGRALAAELCDCQGAVMDIGQTSIKLSDEQGRIRVFRDLTHIPLACDAEALDPGVMRRRTVDFFARVLGTRARPPALVLALPCEIDVSLAVAGCSYPWRDGDTHLVEDVLSAAALSDVFTIVLNDAELAAVSVALVRPPAARTLVLTIGRGVGGAYLPVLSR